MLRPQQQLARKDNMPTSSWQCLWPPDQVSTIPEAFMTCVAVEVVAST